MESVLSPTESMEVGKPELHDFIVVKDKRIKVENNIAASVEDGKGDVEKGFAEADVIIDYTTCNPYHTQLETKTSLCQPEPAINTIPAAVANAIYNALGIRSRQMPITAEKVLRMPNGKGFLNWVA